MLVGPPVGVKLDGMILMVGCVVVIAGFFTGGALAVRGGVKAARNSAIGCACLLAIIEGVGIGLNRVMAANNVPQNPPVCFPPV